MSGEFAKKIRISFASGTLVIVPEGGELPKVLSGHTAWDERISAFRAAANDYAAILRICGACDILTEDSARNYKILDDLILSLR